MLKEFIDFVDSVLPSVAPDFREGAKNAISQFESEGRQLKYTMLRPLAQLSQGDVLSSITFRYFEEDGSEKSFLADAMVLSTSCNIDRQRKILLSPVFPISQFQGDITALKNNQIFDYMYVPDGALTDKFVDFGYINTYSTKLILHGIESQKFCQIASLNQLGYYFFIIKLTVFLMRKEDSGTLQERRFV